MMRRRLPDRRPHEAVTFEHNRHAFTAGLGRFGDGRLAEVFINGTKFGSAAEASAQEAALVASIALQYGCPLDVIQHALARNGRAGGPIGALLLAIDGNAG